ncbi:MAG: HK97 family phage prohead protease [Alphaproteobacteria bacterium]|nr:HK97 family phage prohead protease [Alphaproteobacteria bacterium]
MPPQVTHLRRRLAHIDAPAAFAQLKHNEFAGYASLFGVADGAGDVVAPGAFAKSLARNGIERIRMLYQHFAHEPIGVWEEIREDTRGLYVRGRLTTEIERGRDVLALLKDGAINGLSIGFKTQRARRDTATGRRVLLEVELWEVSIVTFPLLQGSTVTAIGAKSATAEIIREAATHFTSSGSSPAKRGRGTARSAVEGARASDANTLSRASRAPPPGLRPYSPRCAGGEPLSLTSTPRRTTHAIGNQGAGDARRELPRDQGGVR